MLRLAIRRTLGDTIQVYRAPVNKILFLPKLALLLDFKSQANELLLLVPVYPTLRNTIRAYRAGAQSYSILLLQIDLSLTIKYILVQWCPLDYRATNLKSNAKELSSLGNRNDN